MTWKYGRSLMHGRRVRILRDSLRRRSLREHYWAFGNQFRSLRSILSNDNREFRQVVKADLGQFLRGSAEPCRVAPLIRAREAVQWLARAQDATPDGGVSFGYFPLESTHGWHTSYPETTGYIIVSLIDYFDATGDDTYLERALRMGRWEVDVQMSCGAVQGGRIDASRAQSAAAFNTGMVLHGWTRLLERQHDERIFDAAHKAAKFLVADMTDAGDFRTSGEYVSRSASKKYNSLCGWALYLFGQVAESDDFKQAGIRAVEAALVAQHANGWFENCSLGRKDAILTHTLGYTLQACVEVGVLANRQDFIDAAKKGVDAVVPAIHDDGFLCSWFYSDWSPALFSSCLTGSAQLAIVLYRLSALIGCNDYAEYADRLVDFLKGRQIVAVDNPGIRGALAGSFPIVGQYMTSGYPNWATKYLLDALLLQERTSAVRAGNDARLSNS